MDQRQLSIQVCENIKQVQFSRFKEVGFSEEEVNDLWFRYQEDYLKSWREYVANGLVLLPKGLKKVLTTVIHEMIRRN